MTDYDYTWKVMLLGDANSGKNSLVIRYISGFFLEDLRLTIGVDFFSKTTSYRSKNVKLQFWDFGGEERFRFLLHQYCKGANAALFLYDITNRLTLQHLPEWLQIIQEHAGNIPIMLVGTKLHLENQRAITREEAINVAHRYNLSAFVELSSRTGQNVEESFDVLTEILFERYNVPLDPDVHRQRNQQVQALPNPNPIRRVPIEVPIPDPIQRVPIRAPIRRVPIEAPIRRIPIEAPIPFNKVYKEYKINKFLVLKLENNRTNIYVKRHLFTQCKYLLMNLDYGRSYNEIGSIDEAAETLDRSMEVHLGIHGISPETEFWGHCSNLQAWYEHKYDTRILHRNLAFPLLHQLAKAGDPLAKKVFIEEIGKRLETGYPSVVFYLIQRKFIDLLSTVQLNTVIEGSEFIKNISLWLFSPNVPKWLYQHIHEKLYDIYCPYCKTKISTSQIDLFIANRQLICQNCHNKIT